MSKLIFLIIIAGISYFNVVRAALNPIAIGCVVWVEGKFQGTLPGKKVRNLNSSSLIYKNDLLSTGPDSKAEVRLSDRSLITFRPDTQLKINEYYYHNKNQKGSWGKQAMQLIKGGFRTITGLIAKDNPQNYSVNTPVATLSVRGTDYDVVMKKNAEQKWQLFLDRNEGHKNNSPCMKGQGKMICLDEKNLYAAEVEGKPPVLLKTEPKELDEDLKIGAASIRECK